MNILERNGEVEKRYVENFKRAFADLEAKLSNAVGQQILVVENGINHYGCGGRNSEIETTTRLGVLKSPHEFVPYHPSDIENKLAALKIIEPEKSLEYNLILPTDSHAVKNNNRMRQEKWELKREPIVLYPFSFINLGEEVGYKIGEDGCFSTAFRISKPALEFHIGEDVERFFRFNDAVSMYRKKSLQETVTLDKLIPEIKKRLKDSH